VYEGRPILRNSKRWEIFFRTVSCSSLKALRHRLTVLAEYIGLLAAQLSHKFQLTKDGIHCV